jgi:hypothetical protein
MLPSAGPAGKCPGHTVQADGFCSTCGARLSTPAVSENFGPWGLLAVAGVTAILLFASVPALAFVGGVPYNAQYTPQGFSSSAILATPSGWQVNSTTVQKFPGIDLYAVVKVYVPLVHPETKNYTVYYEVAANLPVSSAPSGGELAGWNRVSNVFTQLHNLGSRDALLPGEDADVLPERWHLPGLLCRLGIRESLQQLECDCRLIPVHWRHKDGVAPRSQYWRLLFDLDRLSW